jgi:hypothetical protein
MKYCIKCSGIYDEWPTYGGNFLHESFYVNEFGQMEADWCEFDMGFADSFPPEALEYLEWVESLNEPSPEDMEISDRSALELLEQFIGG